MSKSPSTNTPSKDESPLTSYLPQSNKREGCNAKGCFIPHAVECGPTFDSPTTYLPHKHRQMGVSPVTKCSNRLPRKGQQMELAEVA